IAPMTKHSTTMKLRFTTYHRAARGAKLGQQVLEKIEFEFLVAGCRAAFMDRFVLDAVGKRIRQAAVLGSGMDTRAYRLDLPPQMRIVEVDEAAVHEAKAAALHDQSTRCSVRRAAVDLPGGAVGAGALQEALASSLDCRRPSLFVLDGALEAWAPEAGAAALAAAVAVAAEGSIISGAAGGGPGPGSGCSEVVG
ncbi:unnamed protein product, partial [Prorocentrum cordatum]